MQFKYPSCVLIGLLFFNLCTNGKKNIFPESPDLPSTETGHLFSLLAKGDNREESISKLQQGGYLGYRELHSNLIKSPVRWDGHAFELTCKYNPQGFLELCLIQGRQAGKIFSLMISCIRNGLLWQTSDAYGKPVEFTKFPDYDQVPYNDGGGYVTDRWDLEDRTILLSLQSYSQEDCCSRQMLDFSCCLLLIQPK